MLGRFALDYLVSTPTGHRIRGIGDDATSQARRPFPPPGSRPTPEKTRKAFSLEVYALEKRLPPGVRTRDGQTKSFLTRVTRWRRQKQLPSLELESPCGDRTLDPGPRRGDP